MPGTTRILNATLVGCGAIGRGVLAGLENHAGVRVAQVVASSRSAEALRRELAGIAVATRAEDLPERPEVLLECAGHGAVVEHVLPALESGIDCIVCSIGALAAPGLPDKLAAAATAGGSQLQLVAGAIGGIDAMAAARVGGLAEVVYTGRKPPHGWKGTPAEDKLDLDHLETAAEFFAGPARQAARLFPKNANVAATVSFAGVGLDDTQVRLIADPEVEQNVHHLRARGAFGELEVRLAGFPLPDNPKTSALTVYSAVRAVCNRVSSVAI